LSVDTDKSTRYDIGVNDSMSLSIPRIFISYNFLVA